MSPLAVWILNLLEIIELFRKLNRERGQTIVMVTHSPEIGRMADRIIHFRDGKIEYL